MALVNINLDLYVDSFNEWLDHNEIPFFVTSEMVRNCLEEIRYPGERLNFRLTLVSLHPTKTTLEVILTGEKNGKIMGNKKWILHVENHMIKITAETFSEKKKRVSVPRSVSYTKDKFTFEEFASIWSW
jgi:hypothetical protein